LCSAKHFFFAGLALKGVFAINPFTNKTMSFVVSDHYRETFKTPAVLGSSFKAFLLLIV